MECKDESIDDMLNQERIALENDGVIRKKKNYFPNALQPYAMVKTNFQDDSMDQMRVQPPEATVFSKGFTSY
jgi:hypothetical protein